MSKAIAMTSDGRTILIETDLAVELPAGYPTPTPSELFGVPAGMDPVADVGALGRQFDDVRHLIVTCCNSLYESLTKLPHPERVAVEFGVKLAGEAGVPMLTKASGEANFKVMVEWKPPKQA